MRERTRAWLAVAGGTAAGLVGVTGLSGAAAGAEPVPPTPPVTVTQTVTVVPFVPMAPKTTPATTPVAQAVPAAVPVAQPTLVPATSGSLDDYFKSKGVRLEPQKPQGFKAVNILLPVPRGWLPVPDPNVPDAFLVIADRVGGDGLYTSNAQIVVYKLIGDFDPKEAITHGFINSQSLMAWRTTNASLADFYGLPSSLIEGTYRQNDMTLNTSQRHVIVPVGADKYLVSLSVTTSLSQVVAAANATDAIVNGFRVAPGSP
jgi:Probable lipoprotein LpqN